MNKEKLWFGIGAVAFGLFGFLFGIHVVITGVQTISKSTEFKATVVGSRLIDAEDGTRKIIVTEFYVTNNQKVIADLVGTENNALNTGDKIHILYDIIKPNEALLFDRMNIYGFGIMILLICLVAIGTGVILIFGEKLQNTNNRFLNNIMGPGKLFFPFTIMLVLEIILVIYLHSTFTLKEENPLLLLEKNPLTLVAVLFGIFFLIGIIYTFISFFSSTHKTVLVKLEVVKAIDYRNFTVDHNPPQIYYLFVDQSGNHYPISSERELPYVKGNYYRLKVFGKNVFKVSELGGKAKPGF